LAAFVDPTSASGAALAPRVGARVAHHERRGHELLERHAPGRSPRVVGRHGEDDLVVAERRLAERADPAGQVVDCRDAEVGAPVAHQLAHDDRVGDHQLDREVAVAAALEVDERPGQHELGDRVAGRQAHGCLLAGQAADQVVDRLGLGEQLAGLDVELGARGGGGDPARRALDERRAHDGLHRPHPLRQRGLRHAQQPRGATEAAEVDRRAEGAQLGEVERADGAAHRCCPSTVIP
jgi:hypothetical protein